jgi:hypothetical protein
MASGDRNVLLRRLSPGDQSATQQRILNDARICGTAQWFFDHERTRDWLRGNECRVLWLYGPSISPTCILLRTQLTNIRRNRQDFYYLKSREPYFR